MNHHPEWLPELTGLLDRFEDGGFTEQDRLRLNELLSGGADRRRYFVTYIDVHNALYREGILQTPASRRDDWGSEPPSEEADIGRSALRCSSHHHRSLPESPFVDR